MSFTKEQMTRLRADTPGCAQVNHLNNAGAALMPRPVIESIKNHIELEGKMGGYEAADHQSQEIELCYERLGSFFDASANNFAFVHHATDAYAKALSSIPFQKGEIILTTLQDYNSNQLAFLSLQQRFGIQVIWAPDSPKGGVEVQAMEELIHKHRPKLVAVTHVPTNSGLVQPVEVIGEICQKEDIVYLVDGCQSVGQLPVSMQNIYCDFFSASFRKFMRGPRGAGFLYVSDKVLKKGWSLLFPDLRSAQWTDIDTFVPKSSAQRYEYWEQAYALVLGSSSCIAYADAIGIDSISKRTLSLSDYVRTKLALIPHCKVLDLGKHLAGIVTFNLPVEDPLTIQQYLHNHSINTSIVYPESALIDYKKRQIPWAIRISPHYYNTLEEIDTCLGLLEEFSRNTVDR